MAFIDTRYSSQLLWIEIHDITSKDDTIDAFELSIIDSEGEEETTMMIDNEERESRAKCVVFDEETIIVAPRHKQADSDSYPCLAPFKRCFRRRRHRSSSQKPADAELNKFTAKAVIEKSEGRQEFAHSFGHTTLHVTLKSLGSLSVPPFDDTKSDAVYDKLEESKLSDETLKALKDLASDLATNIHIEEVDKVVNIVKDFAQAHPIISITVKAILIPYEMWKQEHEFKENLKTLAGDMFTSLKSVAEAYPAIESKHAKETATKLVKLILQVSAFVGRFSKKNDIGRHVKNFVATQFPKKLDDYRSKLHDGRVDFREATIVDVLIKSGDMKDRGDDLSYLDRKLKPVEQPHIDGCLKGTRTTYLSKVKEWLTTGKNDVDDKLFNVLWISGAPGAGKTTFSSTVVSEVLGSKCAEFFITRDITDPYTIWPSIARKLADLDRGVKVDILKLMSGERRFAYPKGASIDDQFRELISQPLKRTFADGLAPSRRIVVVIDALDECMDNHDAWSSFLNTLVKWNKELPTACKLVITSRIEDEIRTKLEAISRPLVLDTGGDASDETNTDIRCLFEKGFKLEEKKGQWKPEDIAALTEDITKLTTYAAGLFIWATTVIVYVCPAGKHLQNERLREVLANMSVARDANHKDTIGVLYGQILFRVAWPAKGHTSELDRLSVVLASLTVLRRPLPLHLLGGFSSFNGSSSLEDIKAVVDDLSSIIVTEGDTLRVRHQSVSDFLLDDGRVDQVMRTLLRTHEKYLPNYNSFNHSELELFATFSVERQHTVVAKRCLELMEKCVIGGTLPQTDISMALVYACAHCVDHLQAAGGDVEARGIFYIAPTKENFPNLQERTFDWIKALCEPSSAKNEFVHLLTSRFEPGANVNTISKERNPAKNPKEGLAITHPIMRVILGVLGAAYKLHEELRNVTKGLAREMCDALMFMANIHQDSKQEYAELCAVELMKIVSTSSQYVSENVDICGSDAENDYRETLFDYLSQMRNYRREVILVHKLVSEGVLGKQESAESFLRRKLKPAKPAPDDERCMERTRGVILSTVDDWLKSSERANVFWISGPPGAGKTALASTIVDNLSKDHAYRFHVCVKFFIKERDVNLRDPQALWRSISYQLALRDRGVMLDHLEVLSSNACEGIQNQFRYLICEPLKKYFPVNPSSRRHIVVIIDALDEYDRKGRQDVLDTIAQWGERLPRTCKLLVTSRIEEDITAKLGSLDSKGSLVLNEGDLNSSIDIGYYLNVHLKSMQINATQDLIENLKQTANGVFAWAIAVIEFIRSDPDPSNKLKEVLADMVQRDGKAKDNLGYLYRQILLVVASQQPGPQYLDTLSVVLASVSLPRNPITFNSVCKLLPPNCPTSIVKSVIDRLSPVIFFGDNSKELFARHRSFSDFLRDEVRYETTMKSVINTTSSANHNPLFSALSLARQRSLFEEGYLYLVNACGQRAYPLVMDLASADLHGRHKEQGLEDLANRFGKILRPDRETSDQLDALFSLTEAWLKFQDIFSSAELQALRDLGRRCQYPTSVDAGPPFSHKYFVFIALFGPNALWSRQHKCTDDVKAFAVKLRESLEPTDALESPANAYPKQSQAAAAFLDNLAAAFECVDDYATHFVQGSSDKYRAILEIYQSSMKYWELEFREIRPRNLEGSVGVDWSHPVGEGGFAMVYAGSAQMDNGKVKVAVKRLRNENHVDREDTTAIAEKERQLIEGFVEASRIWSQFNHPNVSKCLGYFVRDHSIAVVSEFANKGDLRHIMSAPEFGIHEAFAASLGIAKGMCFLHRIGVLHGDLKSANVLMSDSGEALIYVSTVTVYQSALQDGEVRVSLRWVPYEYYQTEVDDIFHRTQKSDVWAFGMTVLELLTGEVPYAHIPKDGGVVKAVMNGELPREPTIEDSDPDAKLKHFMWSICLKCWRLKPEERSSMREILEEMLDYLLEPAHSVHGDEERRSGIEYAGNEPRV